jgi:hypothetical protein
MGVGWSRAAGDGAPRSSEALLLVAWCDENAMREVVRMRCRVLWDAAEREWCGGQGRRPAAQWARAGGAASPRASQPGGHPALPAPAAAGACPVRPESGASRGDRAVGSSRRYKLWGPLRPPVCFWVASYMLSSAVRPGERGGGVALPALPRIRCTLS